MAFVVDGDGSVSAAQIDETSAGAATNACVMGIVRAWKFPPHPAGPFRATYPFDFRTRARATAE